MRFFAAALAVFQFIVVVLPVPVQADGKIKVGVILPLSGRLVDYGVKVQKGIELAAIESGAGIELLYEDGQSSKTHVLSAYQKLSTVGDVRFIIGPFGPDETLSIASRAERKSQILIAVSMCSDRYQNFENVFCIYPSPALQLAPLYEEFRREKRPLKSAALITEEAEVAAFLRQSFKEFAEKNGVPVVADMSFREGTADFRSLLTKLKVKTPELLAICAVPLNAVNILKQADQLRVRPKYVWYLSEHDSKLFQENREVLEGVFTEASPPKLNGSFVQKFQDQFQEKPDFYHGLGYDAATYLFAALKEHGESFETVRDGLIRLRLSETAVPGFYYEKDRTVNFPTVASIISGGEKVPLSE